MPRSHHHRPGFSHDNNLIILCVVMLSVAILLPAVKRLLDLGFSWWLAIPLGLIWFAFSLVGMVFVNIALWLEKWER